MSNDQLPAAVAESAVIPDHWSALRAFTAARIALGRTGTAVPMAASLNFALAHAMARDAVHTPLDVPALRRALESQDWHVLEVQSRASDRSAYLARPDWGRRLDEVSVRRLSEIATVPAVTSGFDVAIVVSDGLSPRAAQEQSAPLLAALRPLLKGRTLAPVAIATQSRVALADEIGALVRARVVVCLIGERPGLSAPNSLGAYLTFEPRVGRADSERNCISNIRPEGLGFADAARQICALVEAMHAMGRSGVALRFDGNRSIAPLANSPVR